MHQAQILQWGQAPQYVSIEDLPSPAADEERIKVLAVGIHQVVRSRAGGQHYSVRNTQPPHVPGVDGVGTLEDGTLIYWTSFAVGGLSEYINVPRNTIRKLPTGADPVQVAALVNPAMSSWMALSSRTSNLPEIFTALILGATSASGRVAISLARTFGAGRIIGVARDSAALKQLKDEGLDDYIVMDSEEPTKTDFSHLGDVDVVLDYIYGPLLKHLLEQLNSQRPIQYVQIGSLGGLEVNLPSSILRSKNLTMRGSGPGSWQMSELRAQSEQLLNAVSKLPKQPVRAVPLAEIEKAWNEKSKERLVITM